MGDSIESNMLLYDVLRGVHHNLRHFWFPWACFSQSQYGNACYYKKPGDGLLTSVQEDFSVCFENDRRATQGKET